MPDAITSPEGTGIYIMYSSWDYISLGASGFAQVGQPDYDLKNLCERDVILQLMRDKHPIPDEFKHHAFYKWKGFDHDFGRYHDLILVYNRFEIDNWESGSEEEQLKKDRFYDFVNACSREEFETDEIIERIKSLYEDFIPSDEKQVVSDHKENYLLKSDSFVDSLHLLNLSAEEINKIRAVHFNKMDPKDFQSVKDWIMCCYNQPSNDELKMCAYNEIIGGYGIESLTGEWQNGYWCNIVCTYVNMGDSYIPTIIHHRDKGWLVASYADLAESGILEID